MPGMSLMLADKFVLGHDLFLFYIREADIDNVEFVQLGHFVSVVSVLQFQLLLGLF